MKAICGGRLVLHDRMETGKAVLFEEKIVGIVPEQRSQRAQSASRCRGLW